jgi:hypothetical protein
MVESASAVAACARAVDAGRRGPKGHSARGTGPFGPWRSGATGRVQAGAAGVESAIYLPAYFDRNAATSLASCPTTMFSGMIAPEKPPLRIA